MDLITEEFLAARTGEALEARLRDSDTFRQQMKSLSEASKAFTRIPSNQTNVGRRLAGWRMNGENIISGMEKNRTVLVLRMAYR